MRDFHVRPADNAHDRRHSFKQPFARQLTLEALEERRLLALVPELVVDVNQDKAFQQIAQIAPFGDTVLFSADDGTHGSELWRSDGTNEGTYLLRDVNAGGSSDPVLFDSVDGRLLFVADDGVHGRELWITDGTADGTVLLTDFVAGETGAFDNPAAIEFALDGAMMYFTVDAADDVIEIWRTDATPEGTVVVASLARKSAVGVRNLTPMNGTLFFTYDDGLHGHELWKTDGTTVGTSLVLDINPISSYCDRGACDSRPSELTTLGERLYFVVSASGQFWGPSIQGRGEIWTSDGTAAGTAPLTDVLDDREAHSVENLLPSGDDLYFTVPSYTTNQRNWGLWKIDGATDGLEHVKAIELRPPSPHGQNDDVLVDASGRLFFLTAVPEGNTSAAALLWTSDGTEEGTIEVAEFPTEAPHEPPRINSLTGVGYKLYFAANTAELGPELWLSDGTAEGTHAVADAVPGKDGLYPTSLTAVGDRLFFASSLLGTGQTLWVTDGTEAGTRAVAQQGGGFGSYPQQMVRLGEQTIFVADDGVHGRELWHTDGTANGTQMIVDLAPGPDSAIGEFGLDDLGPLTMFGPHVYFVRTVATSIELWRSDGTAANTTRVHAFPSGNCRDPFERRLFPAASQLLVMADVDTVIDGDGSRICVPWVWSVDPVNGATVQIAQQVVTRDTPRIPAIERWQSGYLVLTSGAVLRTDGTPSGTKPLPPLPSPYGAAVGDGLLKVAGDQVYWLEWPRSGTNQPTFRALFALGAADSAWRLVRQVPVGASSFEATPPLAAEANGKLYFFVPVVDGEQSDVGYALWTSDGTSQGTKLLKEFQSYTLDIFPRELTTVGNQLYFVADDGIAGEELWTTDGTPLGTRIVADLNPGRLDAWPSELTNVGGTLFFSATDGVHGYELWHSDGTSAGTTLVADLRQLGGFLGSSYPHDLANLRGELYFAARDNLHGDELWRIERLPGDTNFDGAVDLTDLVNVRSHFGMENGALGDLDGDGDVDINDLNAVRNNFVGESDGPTAVVDDRYATTSLDVFNVAAPGLLTNDRNVSSVAGADDTSSFGASIVVNADGSFVYDPNSSELLRSLEAGVIVEDSFSYAAIGRDGKTQTATVALTVTGSRVSPIRAEDIAVPVISRRRMAVDSGGSLTETSADVLFTAIGAEATPAGAKPRRSPWATR